MWRSLLNNSEPLFSKLSHIIQVIFIGWTVCPIKLLSHATIELSCCNICKMGFEIALLKAFLSFITKCLNMMLQNLYTVFSNSYAIIIFIQIYKCAGYFFHVTFKLNGNRPSKDPVFVLCMTMVSLTFVDPATTNAHWQWFSPYFPVAVWGRFNFDIEPFPWHYA